MTVSTGPRREVFQRNFIFPAAQEYYFLVCLPFKQTRSTVCFRELLPRDCIDCLCVCFSQIEPSNQIEMWQYGIVRLSYERKAKKEFQRPAGSRVKLLYSTPVTGRKPTTVQSRYFVQYLDWKYALANGRNRSSFPCR